MIGNTAYMRFFKRTLLAFLSACLAFGMLPGAAFADSDAQEVGTAISDEGVNPPHISEDVALQSALPDAQPAPDDQSAADDQDRNANTVPTSQITTSVDISVKSSVLLVEGLEYAVDRAAQTASLIGCYDKNLTGDLVIPSTISDGTATYKVVSLDRNTNAQKDRMSTPDHSKYGGGQIIFFASISLP